MGRFLGTALTWECPSLKLTASISFYFQTEILNVTRVCLWFFFYYFFLWVLSQLLFVYQLIFSLGLPGEKCPFTSFAQFWSNQKCLMWFKFHPHPLCDFSFVWIDGNTFSHSWWTLWKSLWGRCTHTSPCCFWAYVFDILSPVFITYAGFLGRVPMFLASHFIVSNVTSGSLSHTEFLWVFVSDFILLHIEIHFSQCRLWQWFLLEHSFWQP